MPVAAEFHAALQNAFWGAAEKGVPYVDVQAGWLHRQVGGYPGRDHRMPVCCAAMRAEMQPGDKILAGPKKGNGASLVIRYMLPRPAKPSCGV
jgi:5-methylcytosine-specific restriction protein A